MKRISHKTAQLTFGSLFTGAGGFDAALERCGMKAVWQAEIDSKCRSVTARHWPDVAMYDDVRKVRAYLEPKNARRTAIRPERPDLLCGGFPCQDISVAGRRAGLAGSRSGLWFTFRRIAALIRPRWLLIENVDGLRSSNAGRDLGAILKALGDMGYGWAYRVFDSQWFGLAQRRERVFIVGCLGDWRSAGEVLFERDSLPWNPPPSRTSKQSIAASLTRGADSGGRGGYAGRRREDDVNLALCHNSGEQSNGKESCDLRRMRGEGRMGAPLSRRSVGGERCADASEVRLPVLPGGREYEVGGFCQTGDVAHTLRAEGFDASEDGTGRGTPIIASTLRTPSKGATYKADGSDCLIPIAFDTTQITSPGNYSRPTPGDPCHPLASGQHAPAIGFTLSSDPNNWRHEGACPLTLRHGDPGNVASSMGVRRLTPRECERLQGFPDDWTRWDADGNELPDSPRYRMMGNAVSVPVISWIGRRIVEATCSQ